MIGSISSLTTIPTPTIEFATSKGNKQETRNCPIDHHLYLRIAV
jgi:hypothetical protein